MNGQPIMQLTPSSIPATIQLTPQTSIATNNTFQSTTQLLPQQTIQTLPTQPQQQQQIQHKPNPSPTKLQITSQQILKSATVPTKTQEVTAEEPPMKTKNFAEYILQQKHPHPSATVTHTGLTVQRVPKLATKLNKQQVTTTATVDDQLNTAPPKIPLLNVNNVTISRVSTQQQPQQTRKPTALLSKQNQQQKPQIIETRIISPVKKVLNKMLPTKPITTTTKLATITTTASKTSTTITETVASTHTKLATLNGLATNKADNGKSANSSVQKLETRENTTRTTSPAKATVIKCDQCGRSFKKKEHLTQHVKLHAGIRPFKCTQAGCEKTFSRKEHLLRHLISHTGKKMFSCDLCNKPFSRKDNLNKHRR